MQVAYAIACVVVHKRAHQLIARPGPVPVGEMLFAIGFTSRLKVFGYFFIGICGIWSPKPSERKVAALALGLIHRCRIPRLA